jgi:BASS family bile acid:Na+ symporter
MKSEVIKFLKDWMLVIGMISGAGAYLIYMQIPSIHSAGPVLEAICRRAQPILLFLMLFISFSRIEPRQLKPAKWHLKDLLIQVLVFLALCFTVIWAIHNTSPAAAWIIRHRVLFETAMLCMICPTATACAVVTGKLGGDMAQVVMYTILINLIVSVVVPLTVPLLYPQAGITFVAAFCRILAKVFPLLILPCLTAWTVRWIMPRFHDWIASRINLSFYLWSVALTIAVMMSTRAIVKSQVGFWMLLGIAIVSLACCIFQFWIGRLIGKRCDSRIEASQALGQKNTVFGIWMGYTFWNPLVSVAGGFYTIWHNIHNTRQLYKKGHTR